MNEVPVTDELVRSQWNDSRVIRVRHSTARKIVLAGRDVFHEDLPPFVVLFRVVGAWTSDDGGCQILDDLGHGLGLCLVQGRPPIDN